MAEYGNRETNPCAYLLNALEHARTRFAVAIAAESKTTPVDRWNLYRQTEDQLRSMVRELRVLRRFSSRGDSRWSDFADSLQQPRELLPGTLSQAQLLCAQLRDVMAKISDHMPVQEKDKLSGRLLSEGE